MKRYKPKESIRYKQESKELAKLNRLRKLFKKKIEVSRSRGANDFTRFYKMELSKIDSERLKLINQIGGLT